MKHYLLGGALTLGILAAALFGTVQRGSLPLSPAEPANAAPLKNPAAETPGDPDGAARGKQ